MNIEALFLLIAVPLVLDEILQWSPRLAALLIKWNTRRLLPVLRERLREEWLAELGEYPGRLSKLAFAIDTARAAYRIDHERRLPGIPIWKPILVRLFDVIFSAALLFFLFPVLVIATTALLIESRKPVFVRRDYVGRDGKLISCYWLRVGRSGSGRRAKRAVVESIIFRLHLDELLLPYNILRGDLSFVGPGFVTPEVVQERLQTIPGYGQRFAVRPGTTGLAQNYFMESGHRDLPVMLAHDLQYLRRYGVLTNLGIVFRTTLLVLLRRE